MQRFAAPVKGRDVDTQTITLPRWAATDWRLTVNHYRLLTVVAKDGTPWLTLTASEAAKRACAPVTIASRALENLAAWGFLDKQPTLKGTQYRVRL